MKRIIGIIVVFITTLTASAQQGIITIKDIKADVPVAQWYVIATKEYNDQQFFYAKYEETREELKNILALDEQKIEFPKGKDKEGDDYWVILHENEFVSYIYLTKQDDYSFITIVTE